jgi:hypothetical protein
MELMETFKRESKKLRIAVSCIIIVVIYVLSLGPVIRVTEYKAPAGKFQVPTWVSVIYSPLFALPEPFSGWLDAYILLYLNR